MTFRWIENSPFNRELPVWTRAFVSDLLPRPVTPLGWDLVWSGAAVDGWRDVFVDRMGFSEDEIDNTAPELIGVFGGFAYVNASLLRVWAARTPALAPNHVDTAYFGDHPEMPVYVPASWHENTEVTKGPLTNWLSWVLVDQGQSELEAGTVLSVETRANRPDFSVMSDGELVDYALGLKPLIRALAGHHLNQTLAASIGPGIVAAICDEVGLPTSATALISGLGDIPSVSPVHALWTLSRMVRASGILSMAFDAGIDGLLDRLTTSQDVEVVSFVAGLEALTAEVGFRGTAEWEPFGSTIETDPELALWSVDQLRTRTDDADPVLGFAGREADRLALVEQIGEVAAKKPVTKEHFDAAVMAVEVFLRGRERAKANVSRVIHEARLALSELGDRAAGRGDVLAPADLAMLFADELEYYADGGLSKVREITAFRSAHYSWLRSIDPPFVVKTEPPNLEAAPAATGPWSRQPTTRGWSAAGDVLFGKPGAAGVGRGRARIAVDGVFEEVKAGEVLIAPSASVLFSPLFVGTAAIVVESGGLLSHAAIINRELGIPTVVRAAGATSRIADGSFVEVDGTTGVITVVDAPLDPESLPPMDG